MKTIYGEIYGMCDPDYALIPEYDCAESEPVRKFSPCPCCESSDNVRMEGFNKTFTVYCDECGIETGRKATEQEAEAAWESGEFSLYDYKFKRYYPYSADDVRSALKSTDLWWEPIESAKRLAAG